MNDFSNLITNWYSKSSRNLPWRKTCDPYKIWLSEVILQQTRVDQGLPYYLKFINAFPNVTALANAQEDQILKLWQGLGYYSRARNLHHAAQCILSKHNGVFPSKFEEIMALKGVGKYTASAIASFAFKQAYAVVDGNVYRLLSRFFGIKTAINSSQGVKEFQALADTLIDKARPDIYNQAIMEFGSQVCQAKKPKCLQCSLSNSCIAYNQRLVGELPNKISKSKKKELYFDYFFIEFENKTYIRKRIDDGIWKNLYEFPLIQNEYLKTPDEILSDPTIHSWFKNGYELKEISSTVIHVLSHRKIYTRFWHIKCQKKPCLNSFINVPVEQLHNHAVSRLIENYLKLKL